MRVVGLALLCAAPAWPQGSYVGSPACAACHPEHAARHAASPHANALRPILDSALARGLLHGAGRERGGVVFEYEPAADGLAVVARRFRDDRLEDLVDTAAGLLEWSFGAGAHGQTAVGRVDGRYFEHRISHYTIPAENSLTPGHPSTPPKRARDLLGLRLDAEAAFKCFHCHATGVRFGGDGPDLRQAIPGVQCERCHGPGAAHAQAARLDPSRAAAAIRSRRGNAVQNLSFCGECHRDPTGAPDPDDPLDIRFQPIYLVRSRCFQKSRELSCTACHDPHAGAARTPDSYVAVCLGCHPSEAAPAVEGCGRAGRGNCLPCHMPRTAATAFLEFTDHRIRVFGGPRGR